MKIMATFDGSPFSESVLPQLLAMARTPEVEFILLSVVTEDADDGVEAQRRADRYLRELVCQLPVGPRYAISARAGQDAASMIIDSALREQADVIVMATHGRATTFDDLFGGVTEQVVRSHVAPVLLVHPDSCTSEWHCLMRPAGGTRATRSGPARPDVQVTQATAISLRVGEPASQGEM